MSRTIEDLRNKLRSIDGRGYKAYREVEGRWQEDGLTLVIDHAQGDPFATPSRARFVIARDEHHVPEALRDTRVRRAACCDQLVRDFASRARRLPRGAGMGSSGRVLIDAGDAEVLERSAGAFVGDALELRFRVGLPAQGRRVLGRAAEALLCDALVEVVHELVDELDHAALEESVNLVDDHAFVQAQLADRGLVAFVADGAVLPRASGVSSQPLDDAVPFASPDSLRVTLPTKHAGDLVGMGVPEGICVITGGGFHGKTTLLEAIQAGVYPHVAGDGRERVVSRAAVAKVRSEDGRAVSAVDLSPFIHDLPRGKDTKRFSTQDASGSTSLAAAIVEAVEVGASALLLDEDTCATNLLIRDARMQTLVERETITPLIDRARELSDARGVSLVLVVGGSGDYLDVADRVVLMQDYLPHDVTERARAVAEGRPTGRAIEAVAGGLSPAPRCPLPASFDPRRGRRGKEKVKAYGLKEIVFGAETLDLTALEQLVDGSQARAIGALLRRMGDVATDDTGLSDLVARVLAEAAEDGMYALDRSPELAMPRALEVAFAVNRLRSLRVA
jgi:predicted ABC-class ATPase